MKLYFLTLEEAAAQWHKLKAELAAFCQKRLQEAAKEKANQQAENNEHGDSDEKKS